MKTRRACIATLGVLLAHVLAAATEYPQPMALATEQKEHRLVLLSPCVGTNDDSVIRWSWSPKNDPGIKPTDVAWFDHPDECKLRDDGRTILVTASGGAFADLDVATGRVRAYGNVGGNPHSVDRLPDGAYVVASSDGNRLTVVDVKGAELNPSKQRKSVFPLRDAHGVEWDARRNCLWAITVWDVVRYSYDSERKALTPMNTYSFKKIGFGGGHDLVLFPSPKGDRLWLTAHEGAASLDPDTGAFEIIWRVGCPSVSRYGNYRLFVRSTERWWTDAVTARPVSPPDKPLTYRLKGARFYKVKLLKPSAVWRLDQGE